MTPLDLARSFVEHGKGDEALLGEALSNPRIPDWIYGFHAQQAAEKYVKAALAIEQERPERTHDLESLVRQCADAGYTLPVGIEPVYQLSQYAVATRYPPVEMAPVDRQQALELVRMLRRWVEVMIAAQS